MSARRFAQARLMETWAHGLDCFAAAGAPTVDTSRLWHVADLGYRTLPYACAVAGEPEPADLSGLALDLRAPDGTRWQFGASAPTTHVRGTARDWCRLVTHRVALGPRPTSAEKVQPHRSPYASPAPTWSTAPDQPGGRCGRLRHRLDEQVESGGAGGGYPLLPPRLYREGDHDHRVQEVQQVGGVLGQVVDGVLVVDRLIGAFVVEATNARSAALCMTCYAHLYDDNGELSGRRRRGPACR